MMCAEYVREISRYRVYDINTPLKTICYVCDLSSVIEWYLNYTLNDGDKRITLTLGVVESEDINNV